MKTLLYAIVVVCLTGCCAQEEAKIESADVIWQGTSAGYNLLWTKQDFTYEKNGRKESLFKWLAEFEKNEICTYNEDCKSEQLKRVLDLDYTFRLLSVQGTLVSFELEYYGGSGGGPPARSVSVITFDLDKSKKEYTEYRKDLLNKYRFSKGNRVDPLRKKPDILVRLDELFDGKVILRELLKVEDLSKGIIDDGIDIKKFVTAADLANPVERYELRFHLYGHNIPSDYLTRFSFYEIKEDHVIVELSFPSARLADPRRIRIKLPNSSRIKEFGPPAESFYMHLSQKDSEKLSRKTTKFAYEY